MAKPKSEAVGCCIHGKLLMDRCDECDQFVRDAVERIALTQPEPKSNVCQHPIVPGESH